ncbi:MAG: hypothetical protein E6J87_16105 [Deltaproteobacteria bacterium]|nr:MAG: hypothetical protein E6J87_16105 [Deltaproteobacteria bacterium]
MLSTRPAHALAWHPTTRAAAGLALCLAVAGCVSTRLENRDWVQIRTAHYDIWSSLDADDSMQLAVDLERFRSATEFISGRAIPVAPLRTRVYAFDDRGIGRPFSFHSQRSYLLTHQPGDVLVLRTGGGWEGDAWTELKLEYARRLLWNASSEVLPPWLEEGLPQVVSTLERSGDGAVAGAIRTDHIHSLRDSQWIPFDRLLSAEDLSGWSGLERQLFASESWALCHYLSFGKGQRPGADGALARFRTRIREGADPAAAARSEFGEPGPLQHDVWQGVRNANVDESALRIPWVGPRPVTRAVPSQEVLAELGGLALAIGNLERAAEYLDPALAQDAGSARLLASRGDLREAHADRAGADARYQAALAAAPDDAVLHLRYADLLRARAETAEPAQRAEPAALARSHYARSIELEGRLAESHAGLAATYLVDGEDPAGALAHARTARNLLPGDPEIGLLAARLELNLGDRETARRDAAREMSRARTAPDLEAAQSLLAQIDERAALR